MKITSELDKQLPSVILHAIKYYIIPKTLIISNYGYWVGSGSEVLTILCFRVTRKHMVYKRRTGNTIFFACNIIYIYIYFLKAL